MRPVKIALIGIGGFGANHLRSLKSLAQDGLANLVAVADSALRDHEKTVSDLQSEGVRCYEDFRDMLDGSPDAEAVIVCTPIPLHKDMAEECLHRGLYVYLEKPPVILLSDLMELIRLDSHRKTAVGFIGVVPDVVHDVKAQILQGAVGDLKSIRIAASWPRPSSYYQRTGWAGRLSHRGVPVFDGPATNALSHYVHLASFLAGQTSSDHDDIQALRAELYRARPIESYDTCSLHGIFQSGVECNLALTHACRHRMDVEVYLQGTRRSARISINRSSVDSDLSERKFDAGRLLQASLRNFVEGVRGQTRFFTTLADCIPFLEIVSGMWLSSGGVHTIPDPCFTGHGEEPNTVFDIAGIVDVLERSLREGGTCSELECDWAVRTRMVDRAAIQRFDLQAELMRNSAGARPLVGAGI